MNNNKCCKSCKSCKFWRTQLDRKDENILNECLYLADAKNASHKVGICDCEVDIKESNGFMTSDYDGYASALFTAEGFYCAQYKEKSGLK